MQKLTAAIAAALLVPAAGAQAQQAADTAPEDSWIHVRVEEDGGEKVDLNLPLTMVDVALEMAAREGIGRESLRLGPDADVSVDDLRRLWKEVRDVGEADLVDVRDGAERVRIYKRQDRVHVRVEEDGRQKVRADLPASIVDALLGAEGDRLDLAAAARELAKSGEQEIIRIDDEGTRVRIWVDGSSGPRGG